MINYDATGDKNSWLNEEIFKTATPNVSELQNTYQKFHYRVVDLTGIQLDYFGKLTNKFDWIYETNSSWTPNNVSRKDWVMNIKDWSKIIESGKKLCVLYGLDKPRISHVNGKFSMRFLDLVDVAATVKSLSGKQYYTDELFYWTPDLPEIVIKQAHIIKNYLNGNVNMLPMVTRQKTDLAFKEYKGCKYWLTSDGLHSLIYPYWAAGKIVCGKSPSIVFSNRDEWFFNLQQEHVIKKNWITGLDHLWKTLPDYWKNDISTINKGIKGCWSKDYYLE